jgi:hypothetical protein
MPEARPFRHGGPAEIPFDGVTGGFAGRTVEAGEYHGIHGARSPREAWLAPGRMHYQSFEVANSTRAVFFASNTECGMSSWDGYQEPRRAPWTQTQDNVRP